jgi:predicted ATPase/DNA-binding XRE family transcriptional regulator
MTGTARAWPGAFAELLLRHRTGVNLRQRDLAARCGLSERAIRDLERGVRTPRPYTALAVASALSLAGDELTAFLAAARPGAAEAVPPPLTATDDLVGRDRELRMLLDLVLGARHRLVTVTGPAGMGKSRIAAELVTLLSARTDMTVHMLDLSAVREPDLVGELVAASLGCGVSRLPVVDRVAAHLRDRRVVLVVDRFEQLVSAAPKLVELVRRCPGLSLVVTSQRSLQVRAERLVVLGPLAPAEAAALFARRAAAVSPGFVLDADTAGTVAVICRRVECLPLAIELAAARVRVLPPVELANRLDRRLTVLAGGARDLPARHRSLRAAIESSLEAVPSVSRMVFRWFGAFTGGGQLGDVEAVAAALDADRECLLTGLTDLVDMSLVRVVAEGVTYRYTLPDTVAELAEEQLTLDPDEHRIRRAVSVRYLERLRHRNEGYGPPVDRDAANVRAAIGWALSNDPGLVDVDMCTALYRFYETTGRLVEGQQILCRVAAAGPAAAWARAGQLAAIRGDLTAAADLGSRSLQTAAANDHGVRATALIVLAQTAVERGDPGTGRTHLRAALVEARRAGDVGLLGRVLNNLSSVSIEHGRPRDAERQLRAALEAKRRSGAGPVELGRTLFNLAESALDLGHNELARSRAEEAVPLLRTGGFGRLAAFAETTHALALLRTAGPAPALSAAKRAVGLLGDSGDDRRTEALVELRCSIVWHAAGELAAARNAIHRCLPVVLGHPTRDLDEIADTLQTHAWYLAKRAPMAAAALLGAGDQIRRRPIPAAIQPVRDQAAITARRTLGTKRFDARYQAGAAFDGDGLLDLCDRIAAAPETSSKVREKAAPVYTQGRSGKDR